MFLGELCGRGRDDMEFIVEQKKTSIIKRVNVIVVGGGPAGFGAAIASAKNGAKTLLIERYGFLGGMMTTGLVRYLPIDKLTPIESYGEKKPLQGGIIKELVQRLIDLGGATDPATSYPASIGFETFFPTDPEILKVVLPAMVGESGARILLHCLAVDAVREDHLVKGVIIESKSGRQAILSDVVIDASGDADIAAAAGAEYEKHDKPLMMTLNGALANVDVRRATKYSTKEGKAEFDTLVNKAIKNGDLTLSEKQVLPEAPPMLVKPQILIAPDKLPPNWHRRGETLGWVESVLGDCTNIEDLTRAELETRKMVPSIVNFFRKYVPGYENCYLSYTAPQIGLRESRRVLGDYVLTADKDIKKGLKHTDVIAKCRTADARDLSTYNPVNAPVWDIPYRCIVPKKINGLLVAGRCISIDHKAATFLSPRDISTCMVLGQAAGTAAALSIKTKVTPHMLDTKKLQEILRKQGANLD
jgi:hypothetical protein